MVCRPPGTPLWQESARNEGQVCHTGPTPDESTTRRGAPTRPTAPAPEGTGAVGVQRVLQGLAVTLEQRPDQVTVQL